METGMSGSNREVLRVIPDIDSTKQLLIYSHSSLNARGGKNFTFRTAKGSWKHLSRNQLKECSAVEVLREGFLE